MTSIRGRAPEGVLRSKGASDCDVNGMPAGPASEMGSGLVASEGRDKQGEDQVTDQKKPPDQKQQLATALAEISRLRQQLKDVQHAVSIMQRMGGFADSKAHSMRATRIEDRIEKLELTSTMLTDVAAFHVTLLEDHLKDRHDADLDRDNSIDVIQFRRIRRRMREWAEKMGLIGKRTDIRQARQSENRLRASASVPA